MSRYYDEEDIIAEFEKQLQKKDNEIEKLNLMLKNKNNMLLQIDIYSDYEVEIHNKGAYVSQEDSTPTDISFTHYDDEQRTYISGGKLLELIGKKFQEFDISEVDIKENKIVFEYFNPVSGEFSIDSFTIRRVEKDE